MDIKKKWKEIKGYEGKYIISNYGEVISLPRYKQNNSKLQYVEPKEIKRYVNPKNGYVYVQLWNNSKYKNIRLHKLVARTFIPNPKNLPQVNHIDGNKLDNSIENLEWCDCKYNINEAWKIGLNKKRFGRENNRSRKVEQYDLNGNFIRTWDTIKQAADKLKINTANIIACCQGKYKKSHGFIWRYEE